MTEPVLAAEIRETALAESLTASGAEVGLTSYRGTLTPLRFDAPEAETRALLTGAAVHDLGWLRRVAVRGEDRSRWLSGMVTNTVEALADGSGAYNLVLNAQGRIQGDCSVWRLGDGLELESTADQMDALLTHLDKFIIMDDVELVPLDGVAALGVSGPGAAEILRGLGLEKLPEELGCADGTVAGVPVRVERGFSPLVAHYVLWAEASEMTTLWRAIEGAGATAVGAAALEALRVAEGIPAYGTDMQSRDLPQETSQMRALSFSKGCYLGQEIVERIRSRGQVHRHLRSLEIFPEEGGSAPAAGTELRLAVDDPKAAGSLSSIAEIAMDGVRRIFALGVIRAEAEIGSRKLVFAGGEAKILHTPPRLI
jgi:folate-binding protein YgfZ